MTQAVENSAPGVLSSGPPPERIEHVAKRMCTIDEDLEYFAFTLLGSPDGRVRWSAQTCFAGWAGDRPGRELREACLVHPQKMRELWSSIGQNSVVVSEEAAIALFLRIGGNALVEVGLARRYFKAWVGPHECAPKGLAGHRPIDGAPSFAFRRAPSRKLRMRVLRRDGYRCRICGRRASDHVDVELHVHHVHPFGSGGLTEEYNLMTLCSTCHGGLEPHNDVTVIALSGLGIDLDEDVAGAYCEGVRRHREIVERVTRETHTKVE